MRLEVQSLRAAYGAVEVLRDVSLVLAPGTTLGLVGESGCGKTTLALAALGLLPHGGRVTAGAVRLGDVDLLALSPESLRRRRWTEFAYVPQGAMNAFDPVRDLAAQFEVTWRAHRGTPLGTRAERLLAAVGLDPTWLRHFPHEFSGGMRQRAAIALALLFDPPVIVADEPSTGLDVLVQRQVLDLLADVQARRGSTILLVSHDIAVVAETCDRVAVMYAGEIVEEGAVEAVLDRPAHPYTMGLRRAFPDIRDPRRELVSIPGAPPSPAQAPPGCGFAPRCPFAIGVCRERPPPSVTLEGGHRAACHRAAERDVLAAAAAQPQTWRAHD